MAKKIIWSNKSLLDRYSIYRFWLHHNQSDTFSNKLEKLFNETVNLIAKYPDIGTKTDYANVRVKVLRNYKIFYRVISDSIEIIWDSRQNPDDLKIT
jgi:plasmid stabilization system protein ParE